LSNKSSPPAPAQQARLILQDPRAWEEAQVPRLRLSLELAATPESGLDRDTAEQVWQALQLKPEEVIAQKAQLTAANAKAQAAIQQASAARAEVVQLQTKLQELESRRWLDPVVYGTTAVALGVGWLWLYERKKRIASQEQTSALLSESDSVVAISEGSAYDELHRVDPVQETKDTIPVRRVHPDPVVLTDSIAPQLTPEEPAFVPAVIDAPNFEEVIVPRVPWWKRFGRKKSRSEAITSSVVTQSLIYPATENFASQYTVIDPYENSMVFDESMPTPPEGYSSTAANVELLTNTRIKPESADDAMAHLLEIRMAVQALTVLDKPDAALKLLNEHIDAVPNTCAWAYMQYLDLAQLLKMREAFEAMRKRYRLQFNRLAPYWGEPNTTVQSLDQYDRPMAELSAVWDDKTRAKTQISTWLLGNLHSRRLFQLPAYLDLLDLFEMLEFYDAQTAATQDFVPTVSLLDLDYEFAVEVTLDHQSDQEALRAIPAIKTGELAVDFNLAQSSTPLSPVSATDDASATPSLT
jgi:hypothetical protein